MWSMSKIFNYWGALSPRIRFAIKTVAIAGVTYAYKSQSDGSFSVDALLDTIKIAGTYAVLGLLTPLEPFVGVKPETVQVADETTTIS